MAWKCTSKLCGVVSLKKEDKMTTTVVAPTIIPDAISIEVTRECPLCEIDLEEGDFSDFDSVTNPDSKMTIIAGLGGSIYGLSCEVTDDNPHYGEISVSPFLTGMIRGRFYVDPSSIAMNTGAEINLFRLRYGTTTLLDIYLYYNGSSYQLHFIHTSSTYISMTDASHYAEFFIHRSTSLPASDGYVEYWIDGGDYQIDQNLNNYNLMSNWDTIQFGEPKGRDTVVNGIYIVDELIINETGTLIGAR